MDYEKFTRQYFNVTRLYGYIIGSWPFLKQSQKYISWCFIHILVISSLVTQTSQIVVKSSVSAAVDQIPFLMTAFAAYVKLINYMLNTNKFKELFNNMIKDWQDERTEEEEHIMKEYADKGVFYMYVYTMNIYFCSVVFFCLPFIPRVMDVFVPLNESRPRVEMYPGYYFIENNDDYYYLIMLYTMTCMLTTMCVFIATDTILVFMVQHVCGLLSLAGHRFKSSLNIIYSVTNSEKIYQQLVYNKVCYAIKTHRRALTFLTEIEEVYAMNLFMQVGIVVLAFTITLLKVASITLSMDTYQYYGFLITQLVHILFLTIQGQFVIDLHENVYQDGYDTFWYYADVKTQALLMLVLRRNLLPPVLTAGGLIQLNLDSFAEIVKASVSYFTVLKSV